jgi:apolipoprotein N-acyltransferase
MDTLNGKAVAALSAGAGGAIGWLAWHTTVALSPLALLFPPLALGQRTRMGAAGVAIFYYGISSLPVLQISYRYLGRGHVPSGILAWAVASGILATPWIGLWCRDRRRIWWRLPMALLLVTVPPIGIIGWASPLTPVGLLLPGLGSLGLLLAAVAMAAVHLRWWNFIIAVGVLSLTSNYAYEDDQVRKSDWIAVNTTFGNIHSSDDPLVEFAIAERIQKTAVGVSGRVIVFPEMVVRHWGEGTDAFWQPTLDTLRARGRTVLIGARLPNPDSFDEYRNAVVIRGADNRPEFEQRIPVPVAMWKPWGGKGRFPLKLFAPPTVQLAGERAAILICYEQLLPWSYLTAQWHKPTVIVGLSNAYWTESTVVPMYQTAALKTWGRLFSIPVISATNS